MGDQFLMSKRPLRTDEPASPSGANDDDVERLSDELRRQVRRAKQRISEQMSEPGSFKPTKRREEG